MYPVRPNCYYTYVLTGETNKKVYIGATSDLKTRIKLHNKGLVYSTKLWKPLRLIYFEACLKQDDAYRRERYLKTGMGRRYLKNRLTGGLTG